MKNRATDFDFWFFIRPFRSEVWVAIGGMTFLVAVAVIGPIVTFHFDENSSFLTQTTGWYFFLFVNSFYGGALTMFFASEVTAPFSNIIEIINAYPEWNLLVRSDSFSYFVSRYGKNPNFEDFLDRLQKFPKANTYETTTGGIQRVQEDKVVLDIEGKITVSFSMNFTPSPV